MGPSLDVPRMSLMPHPCLRESGGILGASQPFLTALCLDFGMGKRQRLTKTVLAQRPPAEGRVEIRDLDSPLIFRLAATGGRSFCVRSYLGPGPKERPVRITYPLSATHNNLAAARQWAFQMVDLCRQGIDPRTPR